SALVGPYWRLEDLDGLRDDERRRLKKYRHDTFGFEEYCEGLVARSERGPDDVAHLSAVLDRWEAAFCELRLWHKDRSILDCERNPVAKVLIYEESRITGVRGRLGPRAAIVEHRSGAPVRVVPGRTRVTSRSVDPREEAGADAERVDGDGLTQAILVLARAVDRLSEVIASAPRPRGARVSRAARTDPPNPRAPHAAGDRSAR